MRPNRPKATSVGLSPVALLVALLLGQQEQRPVQAHSTTTNDQSAINSSGSSIISDNHGRLVAGAGGYLLTQPRASPTDAGSPELRQLDLRLERKLEAIGPDLRQLRDFTQNDDTDLPLAKRAWQLMHEHARLAISGRLELLQPHLMQALGQANVSRDCRSAAESTLEAAKRLDSWALQGESLFCPSGIRVTRHKSANQQQQQQRPFGRSLVGLGQFPAERHL